MPYISQKDLNKIGAVAAGFGILDFFLEGKLGAPISRALKKAGAAVGTRALGAAPSVARTIPRLAGTAARVGGTIAMRHPYIAAGATIYVAVKNREQIADLIREGYDVVQELPGAERREEFARDPAGYVQEVISERPGGYGPGGLIRPITGIMLPKRKPKRRSTYNSAVSRAMKALKKSTSYGKKGVLNVPKKAFGFVARTVSKLRRGKKVSSKGASGVVKRSLPGIKKITVRKP